MNSFSSYVIKRLLSGALTLFFITILVMFLLVMSPGEPSIAGKISGVGEGGGDLGTGQIIESTGESIGTFRQKEKYGLNDKWYIQYLHWFAGTDIFGWREGPLVTVLPTGEKVKRDAKQSVLFGDFGKSYDDLKPVSGKLWEHFKTTFFLSFMSTLITTIGAICLGVWSALNGQKLLDKIQTTGVFLLYSLPDFWVGTLLIVFLTSNENLNLFPNHGLHIDGYQELSYFPMLLDHAYHLVLPLIVLSYGSFAFLSRYSRTSILEVAKSDFLRTAKAKGLSTSQITWKHLVPNSSIPLITLMANIFPALLGGSVIVEYIFSIDGLGRLFFEAIQFRNYTMVMANTTVFAFLVILGNLISDLAYCWIDPRVTLDSLKKS